MFSRLRLASLALLALYATSIAPVVDGLAMSNVTERALSHQTGPSQHNLPMPTFRKCTSSQQMFIWTGIKDARAKQAEAVTYLKNLQGKKISDRAWDRFKRWFGEPTDVRFTRVLHVFEQLPNRSLNAASYQCGDASTCPHPDQLVLTTRMGNSDNLVICPGFWAPRSSKKETGYERRARILFHEWVLFGWETYGSFSADGTECALEYGTSECRKWAKADPEAVLAIPDNYAYFAMNYKCFGVGCRLLKTLKSLVDHHHRR